MSQMTYYSYLGQPEVVLQDLKPGLNRDRFNFERVIFLDFDGVLHEQGADDAGEFCFAENFRDVLVEVDLAGDCSNRSQFHLATLQPVVCHVRVFSL
jgi:hypothetical protein